MSNQVIQSLCNGCGRETAHDVVWRDARPFALPDGSVEEKKTIAVRCRGCEDCSIRKEIWLHDLGEDEELQNVFYVPPRRWGRPPSWLSKLEGTEPDLKSLLDEVYSATNKDQVRLLSMGIRSALDVVMIKILCGDVGGFEEKLNEMVRKGHLTITQKENLEVVIDAGSASTHRNFKPPEDLLQQMVAVLENLIHQHYVTRPIMLAP